MERDYSLIGFDWLDYQSSNIISFAYNTFQERLVRGDSSRSQFGANTVSIQYNTVYVYTCTSIIFITVQALWHYNE